MTPSYTDRDAVVALLEAAAARLRDNGWQRGDYGPVQGPNCILGALSYCAPRNSGAYAATRLALTRILGCYPSIWNDEVCPSAQAAVDALLKTAKEVAGDVR